MKKRRIKLVEVIWVDPAIHSGWVDDEDIKDPLPLFRSYGILHKRTKDEIQIKHGIGSEDNDKCDISRFPKGCVKSIRVVEIIEL